MNENKWEPVDVEALIALDISTLNVVDTIGRIGDFQEALRTLAAELDKERLAGKNTANMMLDMATENKSLRSELDELKAQLYKAQAKLTALNKQKPVARVINGHLREHLSWLGKRRATYLYAEPVFSGTALAELLVEYAYPVAPPAAAPAVPDLSSEPLRSIALVRMQRVYEEAKRVTVYTLADMLDAALSAQQETPR